MYAFTCQLHGRYFATYSQLRAHLRAEHGIRHISARELCEFEICCGSRFRANDYGNYCGPRPVKDSTASVASSGISITREELQEHISSCLTAGMRAAVEQARRGDERLVENIASSLEKTVAKMATMTIRQRLLTCLEAQRSNVGALKEIEVNFY